jgi:arylsulfatase
VRKPLLEQRWPWLVAAGAVVIAFLSTFIEIRIPGHTDDRPRGSAEDIAALRERTDLNVLFILVDMLRADRLGSYGYHRDTSPELDRFAKTGIRFANHLSQSSWTKSSMASLFTGHYPALTGVTRFDHVIPDAAEMPAETLAAAGFQTVGFYRNGWVAPTFGFGQGFQVYKRPMALPVPATVKIANPTITDRGSDESPVQATLEFLRFNGRKRWFVYLHLMDLHEYLYDEDSALFGNSHSDIYDNSIRHTDSVIGVLLEALAEEGYRENTVIAIAADHGEAFSERGFDGHAREVYRETTEVPFLLSLPIRLDPGITVEARTRNVDIFPTILDLVGIAMPEGADGRSLVPEIQAAARGEQIESPDRTAIAHLDQAWSRPGESALPTVAVAEDTLRYVRVEQPDGPLEQLFDRRDDPAELHDRAEGEPETVERLRGVADRYLASKPSWGDAPTRELDELELNQLRALGYVIK